MLILPPGHAQSVRIRRPLSRRETRLIGVVLGVVAALIIAVAISLGTAGHSSHNGCIYATIPAPTGAQEVNQCGAQARTTCESVRTPGSFTTAAARSIAAECRKAALPVNP